MFYHFLRNGKGDKIKRKVMINEPEYGGLKMIDLCSFNKSLKTTWVKKYLDTTNHGKWKFLFDLELENYGLDLIFRGNLNVSDTKKEVRATDPFLKEILEYWAEINFLDQVSSDIAFQEQVLWFNSLIRIDNKPIFLKEWFEIGISKVKHLQSGNDNFLTLKDFAFKHDLRVRPLSFFGSLSAVKQIRKNVTDTAETRDHTFETLSENIVKREKPGP